MSRKLGNESEDMIMVALPKTGYFKRMRVYFAEMYPVVPRLLTATLLYLSFVGLLGRIHKVQLSLFSGFTLLGIWNIFAIFLILRLMDELKDKETDLELFRERPLPSGRVLESDISFSLAVMFGSYLAANIWIGKMFWMAAALLGYSVLMFKYFFIPKILRRYLLLNLATHNPIIPLTLLYVVVLFSLEHGLRLQGLNWSFSLLLIAMYWAMGFAWEIARKIRSREEENAYVTYSQILGRLGAVLLAGVAQTVTFLIGLYFYHSLSLSWPFVAILAAGYAAAVGAHGRFVFNPNRITSRLKPSAEWFMMSLFVALLVDQVVTVWPEVL